MYTRLSGYFIALILLIFAQESLALDFIISSNSGGYHKNRNNSGARTHKNTRNGFQNSMGSSFVYVYSPIGSTHHAQIIRNNSRGHSRSKYFGSGNLSYLSKQYKNNNRKSRISSRNYYRGNRGNDYHRGYRDGYRDAVRSRNKGYYGFSYNN